MYIPFTSYISKFPIGSFQCFKEFKALRRVGIWNVSKCAFDIS